MRTTTGRRAAGPLAALLIAGGLLSPSPAVAAERGERVVAAPAGVALLAATRPSKVTVPARYVYNPRLGVLHDYCTYAPDEFPAPFAANADFRGPCARHDLCYAGDATKRSCDKALRRNMFRNCEHYYGARNPLRAACKATALTYWAAVVAS